MNPLLHGSNADERIVAAHPTDDRTMRLYFRDVGGVTPRDDPFYPFLFLSTKQYLEGFPRKHWIKRLESTHYYAFIAAFEEWSSMWDAARFMLDAYNAGAVTKAESVNDLDFLHMITDPVHQYLLQSGRTMFKGMRFEDLHRLQLDIETYTAAPHRFSNAARESDRIILIALTDNRGWEHLIDGKDLDEPGMLKELVTLIRERDPDVIEGHNILGFDLPYILQRCNLRNVAFAVGRDGSSPRSFDARTTFGERFFEYTVTEIAGRHIIDTYLLVQSFDMGRRDMESHGLKYAAQYFGIAKPDRTYIKGDRISWHWDHDPEPLRAYAMDDVYETRTLSDILSGTSFYLTQMLPMAYQHVARSGSAIKIESLMVREYLRRKHSLPQPEEGTQTSGGYTDIFVVGVVGPVLHVDVESLYPSIMLHYKIAPSSDVLGVFQSILRELTRLRLTAKRAMQTAKDANERSRLDAQQSSLKILINSFYGYLGYSRGMFNDFSQADEVTRNGQMLLRQMIVYIQDAGGKVVEVDTDGVFFVPPSPVDSEEKERQFVGELASTMPEGITVALDGRYKRMLSYKKKNYALLTHDNRIIIKGSSLTSRSMERFGRTYIHQLIDCMLNNNIDGLHTLYTELHRAIAEHKLTVKDFARTEVLRDSLQEYTRAVDLGKRNRSAAYEVAFSAGLPVKQGDRVTYYITGNDPNPKSFEQCKPADQWDPNFPDENVPFYHRRLDEFSEKLAPFFLPRDFRAIFSVDDLFPFDSTGIVLLTTELPGGETPEDEEPGQPRHSIWLDE
jgi:DNA polymerase I